MFAIGYALQACLLNRVLGDDILPPLLVTFGLSIIIQNGLLTVFSRRQPAARRPAASRARLAAARATASGDRRHAAADLRRRGRGDRRAAIVFYRTALGRAFRAVSDDPAIAQLMGIDNRHLFARRDGLVARRRARSPALFLGVRANFDPVDRAGAG